MFLFNELIIVKAKLPPMRNEDEESDRNSADILLNENEPRILCSDSIKLHNSSFVFFLLSRQGLYKKVKKWKERKKNRKNGGCTKFAGEIIFPRITKYVVTYTSTWIKKNYEYSSPI